MTQTNLVTISPAKLERRIEEYFAKVKKKKSSPSMTGLALHLGTTRRTLLEYKHTDRLGALLENAKTRCENVLEERMIAGVPPTGMIFILKNNYGWTDKIEVDQTLRGNLSLSSLFDQAQAMKKLKESNQANAIEGEVVEEEPIDNLFGEEEEEEEITTLF